MAELQKELELGWLVGILEGEGSFSYSPKNNAFKIAVTMTDEDVVHRVHEVAGCGRVTGPYWHKKRKPHWKPFWIWTVLRRKDVAVLLLRIYPLMGERRQQQIAVMVAGLTAEWRRGKPAKCGFPAGYAKHLRQGEETCRACRDANNVRKYAERKKRKAYLQGVSSGIAG